MTSHRANVGSTRPLILIGLVVGLVFIGAGGILSLLSIRRMNSAAERVSHTFEIITRSQEALDNLTDIEAGSRGYMITGDRSELSRMTEARAELPAALQAVRETIGSSAQQDRWREIETAIVRRAEFSSQLVRVHEADPAAAVALSKAGQGIALRRLIAGQMRDFHTAEQALLAARQKELTRSQWISFGVTGGTAVIGMMLVAWAGWLAVMENRRRSRSEQAALEMEELARITLSSIGDGVITADAAGHITQLNAVAEELTGWKTEDARGQPLTTVFRIINEYTREPAECPATRALREGIIVTLANHTMLIRKDGTELPIADSAAPIRGETGNTRGVVLVFRDQTAKQAAEKSLRESAERLQVAAQATQRIMQHSLDVICTIDAEGKFVTMSAASEELWGYQPHELQGRQFMELVHPEDHPKTTQAATDLIGGIELRNFENRYIRKDGSAVPILWSANWSPADQLMFCVARDISERKKNESVLAAAKRNAEEANRAKSQFLANMSHELRTPLNAIIGFSEILEDGTFGPLNPKQTRYVANVLSSGRHLLQLINDVLDLAKVESGKLELNTEDFAPRQALENVLVVCKTLADKKGIAVSIECDTNLPLVHADQSKFKQVLYNLLSNAVKFTPDGGAVKVTCAVVSEGIAGTGAPGQTPLKIRCLRVSVSDTGIGIKPADHTRVWKEFEQVDSTYARAQMGTGLGLALTKKLVELHGGRIWLESEGIEGKGSTFTFDLPLAASSRAGTFVVRRESKSPFTEETAGPASGRPLVLVVEDDATAVALLRAYLLEGGYDMAHAPTAAAALELARALRPVAITLDVLLPDVPGWEVLTALKAQPETRDIPVIIVSVTDDKRLGFSLGAVEFLVKPVRRQELMAVIRRAGELGRKIIRTVLIVDDDPVSLQPITESVAREGFVVQEALSGAEAIRMASIRPPDFIILDLMMPGMTGFEVVERLRADPRTAAVPILIYTSKDLTADERARLNRHVQGIRAKPARQQLLDDLAELRAASRKSPPTMVALSAEVSSG